MGFSAIDRYHYTYKKITKTIKEQNRYFSLKYTILSKFEVQMLIKKVVQMYFDIFKFLNNLFRTLYYILNYKEQLNQ